MGVLLSARLLLHIMLVFFTILSVFYHASANDIDLLHFPDIERTPSTISYNFLDQKSLDKPAEILFDSTHAFDMLHYKLTMNFPMVSDYYSGDVIERFQVMDDTISHIRLNAVDLIIDSAFVGTLQTSYDIDDTSLIINLGAVYRYPETLSVRIFYHDTADGRGYYHYARNSYTMAEPQDARWWFPCYDEPWDKSTAEIIATVPENYKAASNGYLSEAVHNPADHTRTYHWISDSPIATYLMNLIMGDYASWNDYYITDDNDSILIYNMVWREDSSAAAYDFATVPNMMRVFSGMFGAYPFEKYGQGVVSPFAAGGMEHQTMTTLNRTWITGDRRAELGYAHELAHSWWGNLVTLADWRHIWLNEGFATYASALYNEAAYGETAFALNMLDYQNAYYAYEHDAGRHPIFDPPNLFTVNVYVKGAWVLHMLRGIMGDSSFFGGLRAYASTYAFGNASTDEFRDVMEDVCNCELDSFFAQWVHGQGFPIYNYSWEWRAEGDSFRVSLDIAQIQENSPIFTMPIRIKIVTGDTLEFRLSNYSQIQHYELILHSPPTELLFDPDNWIMDSCRVVTGIDDPIELPLPNAISIENIYPNPFNSSTTIRFVVNDGMQMTSLSIFDIEGRLIRRLMKNHITSARYATMWDGLDDGGQSVASGVYFVRLASGRQNEVKKVTLLR